MHSSDHPGESRLRFSEDELPSGVDAVPKKKPKPKVKPPPAPDKAGGAPAAPEATAGKNASALQFGDPSQKKPPKMQHTPKHRMANILSDTLHKQAEVQNEDENTAVTAADDGVRVTEATGRTLEKAYHAARQKSQRHAAASAEHSAATPKDSFAIYQLRDADENTALRFMSHDYAQQKNQTINHSRYALAYTADLLQDASKTLNDHLNELYYRFNQDHPEDFRGHSLSVSDVVAIRHQGELTCMYVDSFGFKPLPDFYADNPLRTAEMSMEDDMNLLDGRINNGRSDAVKAELPDERRPSVHDQLRKPPAHADKPKKSVQNHAEMEL